MIDPTKHPNFHVITNVAAKLGQITTPIKTAVVVVSLENDTCGVVIEGPATLSEQAKINVLLQVMRKLNIPFKQLEKYGNLDKKNINLEGKQDGT